MGTLKRALGIGGRGDDRKQTPEEIAEERIEAARKFKGPHLGPWELGKMICSPARHERFRSFHTDGEKTNRT
jgi:hypothetical protein